MKRVYTGILIITLAITAVITGSFFSGETINQAEHGRTLTIANKL